VEKEGDPIPQMVGSFHDALMGFREVRAQKRFPSKRRQVKRGGVTHNSLKNGLHLLDILLNKLVKLFGEQGLGFPIRIAVLLDFFHHLYKRRRYRLVQLGGQETHGETIIILEAVAFRREGLDDKIVHAIIISCHYIVR
jgi:hypothetical protein